MASSFCRRLPKVELHAHLNGSLRPRTIKELFARRSLLHPAEVDPPRPPNWLGDKRLLDRGSNFDVVFDLFPLVQRLTDSPEAIQLAVRHVCEDFASDNVAYLELRSTPRAVGETMTRENYVRALVDEIRAVNSDLDISVRLLLSIDRRKSLDVARETKRLCEKFRESHPDVLVGIELSGDAAEGDARMFLPLLKETKEQGLKLSVHLAEVRGFHDETKQFLEELLDSSTRLGHGTCVHPSTGGSEELWKCMRAKKVPVEACLTSNVFCRSVSTFAKHHVKYLAADGHPYTVCTDDVGIFGSELSHEYEKLQQLLALSDKDLYQVSLNSINYIFGGDEEKTRLRTLWSKFKESEISLRGG